MIRTEKGSTVANGTFIDLMSDVSSILHALAETFVKEKGMKMESFKEYIEIAIGLAIAQVEGREVDFILETAKENFEKALDLLAEKREKKNECNEGNETGKLPEDRAE